MNAIYFIPLNAAEFQHSGLMERCIMVNSKKFWSSLISATAREFHKNNQYILATQVTQVFYLQDLARQPRGWKVVEHVYHRDVAESDPDVIHGSSSSHVTLSVGLTNVEHTDLSTNDQATEVDAPPVNDDNANANEDNEDDVAAHVLDDDDVVVSDDDEVNPSTNVGVVMACVGPSYHGGDAGGDPPNRPNRPVPTQCQSSMPRIETGSEALRKAYRKNKKQPLPIGFDVTDLGTYHPIGDYSSMLNTLMGETIRPLPFNCEWDEIPKALKAHIFPTLESYFNLAHWYANQEKVVVGDNVYTVGDRVKLGLELKLRVLWRKAKNRIKANHFTRYPSAEVAKNHLPPPSVWEGRTQEEWNELVDWFSHPDQVARSAVNAANRAKNTIPTHQGKKSFAQGRNEYKVEHGHYEDLIETWRKTHSEPKSGRWKSKENKQRYLQMKAMQDQVRGGVIPFMTDQQILDQVVPSENRQNMSGMGRKLPGSGSTSRKHPNKVFADVLTRDEMTQILRQKEQENELLRKQVEEAQQRAYLASLKADASSQWSTAAYQNTQTLYGTLGTFFGHYNSPNYARPFSPHDFNLVPPPPPGPSMPHAPEWAHLLQPPFPTNQPLRPLQPPYPGPFPQPPYPGSFPQPSYNEPFPIPPVNNNTFNNCYHPVYNSTQGIASSSNDPAQRSFYNLVMNPHMTDSRTLDELARDNSLANNDEGASGEEEEEEEGNEGTNDGDYSEENEEEEEGTDGNEE
ncbi:acidic leucine-rich nuclear phosphoprotein 32 family member A [Tanacetum coccineum]